uniref:complement subcomponent C1r n=2 Tax=Paramormyrops kingsleyae TaxID=1676925 RepID=A0A3B3S3L7_9TELE|nr:complement C1r subcomponent-like [Paramormyrops kingsleyae]
MGWIYHIIGLLCVCHCWGSLSSSEQPPLFGEVQTPRYPQPYPASNYEEWELSVPAGYRMQLTFIYMDMEPSVNCFYDSVTVMYDNKVLGKFCGQENSADGHHPGNKPILSPGNHLRLIFQSDDSNPGSQNYVGFSAFYQAIDMDECSQPEPEDGSGPLCSQICHNTLGSYLCSCRHGFELRPDQRTCVLQCEGGVYREMEGVLSSPGYPLASPHGLACRYHISVEPGFIITLNFSELFHIEHVQDHEPSCLYHWLQVSIPGKAPQKLCGRQSPGMILTNSSSVVLEYHTDWEGLSYGWRLSYSTKRVQCESPHSVAQGIVTPTFPEYLYRDYIQVRCDTGYKLMMGDREMSGYFSMCQSDGTWLRSLPECRIIDCGNPTPLRNGGLNFLSGSQNQYLSVIQYHCNEPYYSLAVENNVNYTCAADRKWKDSKNNYIIPTCLPVCGRPTFRSHQKVLGGADAALGQFPWQVLLEVLGGHGGAAVIGEHWILTAAHNLFPSLRTTLHPLKAFKVYAGHNDMDELYMRPDLPIASIHPHPQYHNPSAKDYDNDIALIKLKEAITFNATLMPLCLPPKDAKYIPRSLGMVSGFGITENNMVSKKLKYIPTVLVEEVTCKRFIDNEKIKFSSIPSLTDNMFCAGGERTGQDSCEGDSGGALTLQIPHGPHWAAGIVSWGVGCGMKGTYGVYTRVDKYVDWIKKTMEEN